MGGIGKAKREATGGCKQPRTHRDWRGGSVFKYQHRRRWARDLCSGVIQAEKLPGPFEE